MKLEEANKKLCEVCLTQPIYNEESGLCKECEEMVEYYSAEEESLDLTDER